MDLKIENIELPVESAAPVPETSRDRGQKEFCDLELRKGALRNPLIGISFTLKACWELPSRVLLGLSLANILALWLYRYLQLDERLRQNLFRTLPFSFMEMWFDSPRHKGIGSEKEEVINIG